VARISGVSVGSDKWPFELLALHGRLLGGKKFQKYRSPGEETSPPLPSSRKTHKQKQIKIVTVGLGKWGQVESRVNLES
jgi:hypothetical protein